MRTRVGILELLAWVVIEVDSLVVDEVASLVVLRSVGSLSPVVFFLSVRVILLTVVIVMIRVDLVCVFLSEYVVRVQSPLSHYNESC